MNCEQSRAIIGAEPNSTNPELLAHLEQCPECSRFRNELQEMDRLIFRALAVDVGGAKQANVVGLHEALSTPPKPATNNRPRLWRMAASLLVASLVALTSVWLLTPRESFAAEVIEHVMGEQQSLIRTSDTVDTTSLEKILGASRVRLKPGAAHVSYARSCHFRGQLIPHLVVQSEAGPVTVLVMPEAPSQPRQEINESGFQGVVLPAPRGVIVVLGRGVPVDAVANTVLDALQYS